MSSNYKEYVEEVVEKSKERLKQTQSIIISNPGQALRPLHKQTKITKQKKLEFLRYLAENYNISACAAKIGVTRQAIQYLMNNDEQFRIAVYQIRDGFLDQAEESGFYVALQPSREGFNDRKLMLQSHRQEYQPKLEINDKHTFSVDSSIIDLRKFIDNFSKPNKISNVQDADFEDIKKEESEKP